MATLSTQNIPIGSYYYTILTTEQKAIYQSLLSSIIKCAYVIKLPKRPIDEISQIFNYVELDNPMIFYTSSFIMYDNTSQKKCIIKPEYKYSQSFIKAKSKAITEFLKVFDIVKDSSEFDKELYVHDYCLNTLSYDYTFDEYSGTVLGSVLNKTAYCEGIAYFAKLALDYLGVKCLVAIGKAKNPATNSNVESHAWNIVKIAGKNYHLDVTFDMTLKDKTNRYDYFNLSDDDIKKDHIVTDTVPKCITAGNDYYSQKGLSVNGSAGFKEFIGRNLQNGKKNVVVRLAGVAFSKKVMNKVVSIASQQYMDIYGKSVAVNIRYNETQMVLELDFV